MEKHNQRNTHESFYIKTPIGHPNKGREGEKKRGEQRDQREKERCIPNRNQQKSYIGEGKRISLF